MTKKARFFVACMATLSLTATLFFACKIVVPYVSVKNVASSQTSVTFEIEKDDPSGILKMEKIELFEGEERIQKAESVNVREFLSLRPQTEYVIKVTYSYDVRNGQGRQTKEEKATFRTKE